MDKNALSLIGAAWSSLSTNWLSPVQVPFDSTLHWTGDAAASLVTGLNVLNLSGTAVAKAVG
jgi:hypothetical protein